MCRSMIRKHCGAGIVNSGLPVDFGWVWLARPSEVHFSPYLKAADFLEMELDIDGSANNYEHSCGLCPSFSWPMAIWSNYDRGPVSCCLSGAYGFFQSRNNQPPGALCLHMRSRKETLDIYKDIPDKGCRFRRSTQHLLAVYSPESGSLAFFLGVD